METKGEYGTVRHYLADGTVLNSIEGKVVPATGKTEMAYKIIVEYWMKYHPAEKTDKTSIVTR